MKERRDEQEARELLIAEVSIYTDDCGEIQFHCLSIGGPIGGGIVVPVDPNRNRRYSNLTAYSPYGLPLADWQGDDERYLYSGKELDRDGGLWLYDFHARQYDPQLGRFTTPDPLQEKYLPLSPGRFPSHLP